MKFFIRLFSKLHKNRVLKKMFKGLYKEIIFIIISATLISIFLSEEIFSEEIFAPKIQALIGNIPFAEDIIIHLVVGVGIFIFLTAIVILYKIESDELWKTFNDMLHMDKTVKRVMEPLLIATIKESTNNFKSLFEKEGGEINENQAKKIYDTLFSFSGAKTYRGLDYRIPSLYWRKRLQYLDAHKEFRDKNKSIKKDERILLVSREDLEKDLEINPRDCRAFFSWHKDNSVELYQEGPIVASKLINSYKEFKDVFLQGCDDATFGEVGIWDDKYILLFNRDKHNKNNLRAHILTPDMKEEFKGCINYYNSLITSFTNSYFDHREIKPNDYNYLRRLKDKVDQGLALEKFHKICTDKIDQSFNTTKLNNFEKLAKNHVWEDYVNCPERIKHTGRFLKEILSSRDKHKIKILDAGGGVPCESAFLSELGYSVKYNEYERFLYDIGWKYLRETEHVDRDYTNYNWSQLVHYFGREEFDVVLALGNFASLGLKRETIKDYLTNFYQILKPDGILITDQRNFVKIKSYLSEMKKMGLEPGPDTFYDEKHYSGNKIIFCGKIKGWPVEEIINDNIIKFAYGKNKDNQVDILQMYSFEKDEFKDLLKASGFKEADITVYSDLTVDNPNIEDDYADFFTFVATKSK